MSIIFFGVGFIFTIYFLTLCFVERNCTRVDWTHIHMMLVRCSLLMFFVFSCCSSEEELIMHPKCWNAISEFFFIFQIFINPRTHEKYFDCNFKLLETTFNILYAISVFPHEPPLAKYQLMTPRIGRVVDLQYPVILGMHTAYYKTAVNIFRPGICTDNAMIHYRRNLMKWDYRFRISE